MPTSPTNGLVAAAAPSVMRTMNQRVLLGRLYSDGAATRPQLAKAAGLSLPTVSAALAELLHDLDREVTERGRRGRRDGYVSTSARRASVDA